MKPSTNRANENGEYGRYWLEQRPDSPKWYRVHYDPKRKQNVRVSLRTASLLEARKLMEAFSVESAPADRKSPEYVKLHYVLNWYWEVHEKKVLTAKMQAVGIRYWRQHFDEDTVVADLIPLRMKNFVTQLQGQGFSLGYISRILSVGRAALNAARDNLLVSNVPKIKDCQTAQDRQGVAPMGRPLDIAELAKLINAQPSLHMRVYIFILINTMCRPGAALGLRRSQVDFENNIIYLNPQGRVQTKKHRPILPLTKALREILEEVEKSEIAAANARGVSNFKFDHYITYRGNPINWVKTAWHRMVVDAGLTRSSSTEHGVGQSAVTQYSIRHTIARELRRQRVSGEEISLFLGHRPSGISHTTTIYAPFDPDYLRGAADCIDAYMLRLKAEMERGSIDRRAI